jgi:hypothetical protein
MTQAKAVAGQAKQQLENFVGEARDEVRQQAQQRNDQAAEQLRTLSERLIALAQGRPESAGSLTDLLYDADDKVRSLATRLEQRGPQGVADDVSRFARRRPGLFLAAAAGAGFVIGRAVRAGASEQDRAGSPSRSALTRTSAATSGGDAPLSPVGAGPTAVASGRPQ